MCFCQYTPGYACRLHLVTPAHTIHSYRVSFTEEEVKLVSSSLDSGSVFSDIQWMRLPASLWSLLSYHILPISATSLCCVFSPFISLLLLSFHLLCCRGVSFLSWFDPSHLFGHQGGDGAVEALCSMAY